MLKLGRVTKVKVLFLVLVSFLILAYSNVFEFSAAILEKGLYPSTDHIHPRDGIKGYQIRN